MLKTDDPSIQSNFGAKSISKDLGRFTVVYSLPHSLSLHFIGWPNFLAVCIPHVLVRKYFAICILDS